VPRAEVLATLGVVALDLHVRVAEGQLHDVAVRLLDEDDELLLPVGRLTLANPARAVELRGLFLLLGHAGTSVDRMLSQGAAL